MGGADDEYGPLRCYRSIAHLAYTTILSSYNVSTLLVNKSGDWITLKIYSTSFQGLVQHLVGFDETGEGVELLLFA